MATLVVSNGKALGATPPAPMPQWEQLIRLHIQHVKHGLKTADFGYQDAFKAQLLLSGRYNLVGNGPGVESIKELATANVYTLQTVMEDFCVKTEKIKGSPPDKPAWQKKLLANSEQAKQQASQAIDDATQIAIDQISELPEAAREGATNAFLTAWGFVADVLKMLVEQVKKVLASIVDFLKGIWTQVKVAYNTVVGGVKTAVSFIKGVFGRDLNAEDDAVGGGAGLSYIGRLNWPAAVTIMTASAALAYVSNQLIRRGYQYDSQTLEITQAADGTKTIKSRTRIWADRKKNRAPQLGAPEEDLEAVWQACVNDLGEDGHYIPDAAVAAAEVKDADADLDDDEQEL